MGTPIALSDSAGVVHWKAHYTTFGKAIVDVDNFVPKARFPGQYFDQETGLHYNYFRDYDPEIGRYIQSDPIGLAGGINTYGYVHGNPINRTDPLGLWSPGAHAHLIRLLGAQRGWSAQQIRAAIAGSAYADNPLFFKQSGSNSHIHAMTSDKNKSKSLTCSKSNAYIRDKMKSYKYGLTWSQQSIGGHQALGQALHTIMDNYSPAHSGFQKWDNSQIGRHGDNLSPLPFGSETEENLDALLARPDLIEKMLNDMNNLIDNGQGIDCDCDS